MSNRSLTRHRVPCVFVLVMLGSGMVQYSSPAKASGLSLTSVSGSGLFGLYYSTSATNGPPVFNSNGMLTSIGSSLFPALTPNTDGSLQNYTFSPSNPTSPYNYTVSSNPSLLPAGFGSSTVTGTAANILPASGYDGPYVTRTGVAYNTGTNLQSGASIPSGTVAVAYSQWTATFSYSGAASNPQSVGAAVSANATLGGQTGSFVALSENGSVVINHGGAKTTDSFVLAAAYGQGPGFYLVQTGVMGYSGPNSQQEITLTGNTTTGLFPNVTLYSGDTVKVTANLTLFSDPHSLIELGPLSDVPGPLPTIGVFGGGPAVPEPASVLQLGAGLLVLTGFLCRTKIRRRKQPGSLRSLRLTRSWLPMVACLALGNLFLTGLSASAGTIIINDIDRPMSVSSVGFTDGSSLSNSILQQVTLQGNYLSNDPLSPNQSASYDVVFREPLATGGGFVDTASTRLTITGLNDSTSVPNTSVSLFFEGILSGPINPGPGVYFVTTPGGFFDVAAYLRSQGAPDVPRDLSVLVATSAVPEPSALTLGGLAALISLAAGLVRRSRIPTAKGVLSDPSPVPKK